MRGELDNLILEVVRGGGIGWIKKGRSWKNCKYCKTLWPPNLYIFYLVTLGTQNEAQISTFSKAQRA